MNVDISSCALFVDGHSLLGAETVTVTGGWVVVSTDVIVTLTLTATVDDRGGRAQISVIIV